MKQTKKDNAFINVSFRVASKILPDLLNSFYKENENINLKIYQVNQFTKATPEFDIVVDAVSSAESLGKNSVLLMEEKILLALPKNHFLATKENLALKDLNILPCSLLNSHSSLGKIIITELSERMFFPNIVFESDNPFMVRDFLGLGLSYSFVPEKTWQLNKSYPNIVLRELTDFECSRKIYLQYNSDNFISSSTKKLASHISRYFKKLIVIPHNKKPNKLVCLVFLVAGTRFELATYRV